MRNNLEVANVEQKAWFGSRHGILIGRYIIFDPVVYKQSRRNRVADADVSAR